MGVAWLAWCYPPEPTDHCYLSLPSPLPALTARASPDCLSQSPGPRVMALRGGGETVSVRRIATPPGSWASSHISREGRARLWSPGRERGNEAGSVPWASDRTVLNGSTGDECRVMRGHGQALAEGQAGPHQSRPRWPQLRTSVILLWEAAVSKPDSHRSSRLKETWKGTLEQQDGHNNKADTHQEQEPYRNAPP